MLRTAGLHPSRGGLDPALRRSGLPERRRAATKVPWYLLWPDFHRLIIVNFQDATSGVVYPPSLFGRLALHGPRRPFAHVALAMQMDPHRLDCPLCGQWRVPGTPTTAESSIPRWAHPRSVDPDQSPAATLPAKQA